MTKLLYKNYIKMIKNSVWSKLFCHLYVLNEKWKEEDIMKWWKNSCAYFVSSILTILWILDRSRATVKSLISEIKEKWYEEISRNKIKIWDLILWEAIKWEDNLMHEHVGFYIWNKKAISNSSKKKSPIIHSYTYNNKRKIIWIFRFPFPT
jgi:hypothetical protein